MRPVIQVENLSKHYHLGLIGGGTLREDLHRWWAKARGRPDPLLKIGSLLEVGTGFHPELTGRENIYLNGAILGMKKTEIDRKQDEIIDFAEIEQFIDTPGKLSVMKTQ